MKRFHFVGSLTSLLLLSSGMAVQGAITCSMSDYSGTYAFYTTGSLLQLPPQAAVLLGPFSQSGIFTSDGQGNVIIESTASYNGFVQSGNSAATYTITPECLVTFSLNLPFPLAVPSTFASVLSGSNRQNIVMITDPPGSVIVGRHAKQDQRFCGLADFNGAYQIDISGSISQPRERAGLFQRLGRLVADGAGNFTAKTLGNYAGRLVQEDFNGTYDVSAKCFVNLKYTYGGESLAINGALGGHGETAMVMVTSPGWAVSGQLRAQQ
ncbi:MAG: hypothetical protein EXQ52_02370 [Bryobacterales bacterium]|nr:hypothetical protein [Bryobacterales bacterium]